MKNKRFTAVLVSIMITAGCVLSASGCNNTNDKGTSSGRESKVSTSTVSEEESNKAEENISEKSESNTASDEPSAQKDDDKTVTERQIETSQADAEKSENSDISDSSENSQSTTSDTSVDEDIKLMSETEKKIEAVTGSDEYKKANDEERKKMLVNILTELEQEGYIEKGTIYEYDEMISFQFKGGIFGGFSFKDFSEDIDSIPMNGPESTERINEDSDSGIPIEALIGPTVPQS